MIPNIKNGRSFRGAGKYYLHDKQPEAEREERDDDVIALKPTTSERVLFTATRNCAHDDPELALDEMWATAEAQTELKRANGISLGGRRCLEPVKTISLSWHPDEKPSQEQMIDAADTFLAKMGWQEHQAVYVAHDDTEHAHIHIILNRVHPETGRVLDDRNDFKRAQWWALDYEKEHGRIFCEKRLDYERAPDERQYVANDNIPYHLHEAAKPALKALTDEERWHKAFSTLERNELKEGQRDERMGWFEDGALLVKATRNAVYAQVREEYAGRWNKLYKADAAHAREAHAADESVTGRALYLAKHGLWDEARYVGSFNQLATLHYEMDRNVRFGALNKEMMAEVRERQEAAVALLLEIREHGYKALLELQQHARDEMRELHAKGERADHLLRPTPHALMSAQQIEALMEPPQPPAGKDKPGFGLGTLNIPLPDIHIRDNEYGTSITVDLPPMPPANREDPGVGVIRDNALTGASDLAAGMMGSTASYLADQLGELFAPTPPEVRAAQERGEDKVKTPQPEQPAPTNPYARHIGEAEQKARHDREREDSERYWDQERERRRDW